MRWERLSNGALLKSASDAGFEAFLSVDKNIEYEQNLTTLPLPIVIIDAPSNSLAALIPFSPALIELFKTPLDRLLFIVEPTGRILRLISPR